MSVRSMFAGSSGNSYRYWRLFMSDNDGDTLNISVAELELRPAPGGSKAAVSAITGSSFTAGFPYSYAVDGDNLTAWRTADGTVTNSYLTMDLGSTKEIRQLAIYPSVSPLKAPKNFKLQGSHDNTNFTDVKAFFKTGWTAAWSTFDL